eukprot:CAMPEP_0194251118 /NCGR_PEP_ID=MMETSP0158-20130606/24669_1 /TAXON_ID=33649 /ORGANISM="Thalassionema nitzschioides, Strain L26-B" /LENGTH=216 /DNA_ID=CAMNT_0038988149 /DNA_START=46 /DNA_END=692 /DNA_ORIENTATION=-
MGLPELTSRKRSRTCMLQTASERPSKEARMIFGKRLLAEEIGHGNTENPHKLLMRLVRKKTGAEVKVTDSLSLENFFVEYTEEEVAAYDLTVLTAIRTQDVAELKTMHAEGRPMKCSNKFGESLLHMACRRNFMEVAQFLMTVTPIRIRDDYGRTILHDAAWTCEPNFELIEMILTKCPDLLYLKDARGFSPLAYARESHWPAWNKFLKERTDLIV